MAFCINCGKELADGARFCSACGTLIVSEETEKTQRKTVYEGEIHKCPACGETINAFLANCPACGHEFRGTSSARTLREFSEKLEGAITDKQRISLIRNYPVPNTKEDLLEFMILASSNFDAKYYASHSKEESISSAWFSKIEQCYQKADVTLGGADHERIRGIYNHVIEAISEEKQTQQRLQIKKEKEQSVQNFKKSKFRTVLIIYCILCVILTAASFAEYEFLGGVVGVIIVALTIIVFLMGYGVIKERFKHFRLIPSIIAFLLFVPFVALYSGDLNIELPYNYRADLETIIWDDFALGNNLPDFGQTKACVVQDDEDILSLRFYKIDKLEYDDYVQTCEDYGFVIDADKSNNSFSGYNKKGYRLSLYCSTEEIVNHVSLELYAPIKNEIINWPESELTKDIPVPKSLTGEVYSETSGSYIVYLTNLDKVYFNEYIDLCMEKGFVVDYFKSEDYFHADNKDGTSLSITYEGFNTLCIDISNFEL